MEYNYIYVEVYQTKNSKFNGYGNLNIVSIHQILTECNGRIEQKLTGNW